MDCKNITRSEFITRSIRIVALVAGLFIYNRFRYMVNFVFILLLEALVVFAIVYARKLAEYLIWKDCEVSNKSMFIRFFISCVPGIISFYIQYLITYPQRNSFYETSGYPASMLTLTAIIIGLLVTFTFFSGWYLTLYFIELIKHLKSRKDIQCKTSE